MHPCWDAAKFRHCTLRVNVFVLGDLGGHVTELGESTKLNCLDSFRLALLLPCVLHCNHLLLVVLCHVLFVSDKHSDLHLFLDQVLGLCKIPNEFLPLHLLEHSDLVLVDNIGPLQRFFLVLQLALFIGQLLSEQALFVVQVEEHLEVLVQLLALL